MGRVISDLATLTETVANGDFLVCHNVSKSAGARDEKLTVEKLLTDGLGNLGVTIASGVNVGIGTTTPSTALHVFKAGAVGVPALGDPSSHFFVGSTPFGTLIGSLGSGAGYIQQQRIDGNGVFYNLFLQPNGGRVGIGTTSPAVALHVVGAVRASGTGGLDGTGTRAVYSDANGTLTNTASDGRMKTNVDAIGAEDALEIVGALRPVRYRWNEEHAASRGEQVEVGLIAQEVQAHLPEIIGVNADGMLSVDYSKLTALLIGAVQALTARVEALEAAAA